MDVGDGAGLDENAPAPKRREGADRLASAVRLLRGIGLAGVLCAVIGWEYAPALSGGFVYEDYRMTDACHAIDLQEPGQPRMSVLSSSFWRGRPLTMLTACWQTARQDSPWAWHLVNLGLHLAMTAALGWLVWSLTHSSVAAGVAVAFFGVNAVNVEAVAYLSSRSELIAGLGVVGACLAALRGRWGWMLLALLAGMGGKETAVIALMLVPLCLWWQRRGVWGWLTALSTVIVLSVLVSVTAQWWWAVNAGSWVGQQASAMARVLLVSVIPVGQTVDYDYARVPVALQVLAGTALLAGLLWAWTVRHAHPLTWLGTCWIWLSLLPRLIVPTPLSVFPEHQLYLPLVGVSLIVASVLSERLYGSQFAVA